MKLLKQMIHSEVKEVKGNIFERKSARGVLLDEDKVLMMYTKRYKDYSFPGGGVDIGEDIEEGLKRELLEETGAQNISVLEPIGYIDEYRPHYRDGYDLMHMESYFYLCDAKCEFGKPQFESYEIENGMEAVWVNIQEAINHNKKVMREKDPAMGYSIERETYALELVADRFIRKV